MELKKINVRNGNIEIRDSGNPESLEIVQWNDDPNNRYCWTIAFWTYNEEGYYLQFIGRRPFDKRIKASLFMKLAKYGQKKLDKHFNQSKE